MHKRDLIPHQHYFHQHATVLIVVRHQTKHLNDRTAHDIIDKCGPPGPRHLPHDLHILLYAALLDRRIPMIFVLIESERLDDIWQMIDSNLKQAAVIKVRPILIFHRIMRKAVITEALVIFDIICAGDLAGKKQTAVIIAVNLIRHIIRRTAIIQISLINCTERFFGPP